MSLVSWLLYRRPEKNKTCGVIISGISVGLPGSSVPVFSPDNFDALVRGECRIEELALEQLDVLLSKNVVQMKKQNGQIIKVPVKKYSQTIRVAARLGKIDLEKYGVAKPLAKTMGRASQVAVAAGLEALRDAGLVSAATDWRLPEKYQASTGVVYATSFPALDAAIAEVDRHGAARSLPSVADADLFNELERRLENSTHDKNLLQKLLVLRTSMLSTSCSCNTNSNELNDDPNPVGEKDNGHISSNTALKQSTDENGTPKYSFDRKFLFKVLVLANSQLAQIIGARGPNLQTNAACAGTTQALGIAQDLITSGRCERVVVIAGDDATGDALLPWLGAGFNALGAASIAPNVNRAVHPFDARRNGMILGAGACGLVLQRAVLPNPKSLIVNSSRGYSNGRCRLLATHFSNSAYHGAAMDKNHIADELGQFLDYLFHRFGLTRSIIARRGLYFSHETGTHATPSSSCAANEMYALAHNFQPNDLKQFLILNTKALTGHPMGVGVEDALAAYLLSQRPVPVPPLPAETKLDANLPADLALPIAGTVRTQPRHDIDFALRFAAGFGSQVAFAFLTRV
eukprot:CAMPEP_0197310740 /NCGR_PEP_ID=MMETSP0891-20130614/9299_1 /TAXON_ID=44058 ORGANISM="Aureoumbra lagunensis, Strain CCMP1510" /NCGR_SAMPLE_ID=MMETSP0891 /ASSEMBLY_ACC=CAM_ASM_000534 /LENGTH=573 /DNA_ID=CAMNT_0042796525 /DNA_START=1296 /DNA_END=3017 /DNA_ORIENTATION=+